MKFKSFMSVMTLAAMMSACTPENKTQLASGINLSNLDTTYLPGTDFYMYATGGWQKANPLTAEYSRYGSFDVLQENNNKQLRTLIDSVSAMQNEPGSVAQKIASMFNCVMDSMKLNKEGVEPIKGDIARIQNTATKAELQAVCNDMESYGIPGWFGFFIDADIKDSKNNLLSLHQGGLTLGQKDYYLEEDDATRNIREEYKKLIVDLFTHCGLPATPKTAERILALETRLARQSKSRVELRDDEKNYHKMSYDNLKTDFPGIDWEAYFTSQGVQGFTDLNVGQLEPIHEVEKILAEASLDDLKLVALWRLINSASSCLDDEMSQRAFQFYGTVMSGRQEQRPRWKRAVSAVEGSLGEALGQLYVEKYFPAAAKERMEKLVANLQVALGERIDVQEWMSDSTKKVAREKLDAFYVKVGYPNKWKDYSTLNVGDGFWENVKACSKWEQEDLIARKLNKPVDRDEWYMTPQTVNAYYNPTTNEICFPAGILQPPFFDMAADDAFNYGAIGVVIGHEMTHGFDDQGSKFDKNGNLVQWWTEEDTKRFTERIQVMREFHDSIVVLPAENLHANGSLTLGENMADHGGLMVAYQAFKNATADCPLPDIDGFTPDQRFFLAYANVWGQNIRDEEIRKRVKSDPHELGMWRVNGQLPHIDAWYDAFGITESDPMFVPKEKRVTIW